MSQASRRIRLSQPVRRLDNRHPPTTRSSARQSSQPCRHLPSRASSPVSRRASAQALTGHAVTIDLISRPAVHPCGLQLELCRLWWRIHPKLAHRFDEPTDPGSATIRAPPPRPTRGGCCGRRCRRSGRCVAGNDGLGLRHRHRLETHSRRPLALPRHCCTARRHRQSSIAITESSSASVCNVVRPSRPARSSAVYRGPVRSPRWSPGIGPPARQPSEV